MRAEEDKTGRSSSNRISVAPPVMQITHPLTFPTNGWLWPGAAFCTKIALPKAALLTSRSPTLVCVREAFILSGSDFVNIPAQKQAFQTAQGHVP